MQVRCRFHELVDEPDPDLRPAQQEPPLVTLPAPPMRMPVAFAAFCDSRRRVYAHYAAIRTGSVETGECVAATAFGALALVWPEVLHSPSPAAAAWKLLERCTRRAVPPASGCALYDVLPAAQADVLLLRYRLGLAAHQTADLLGISVADLTMRVRTALRAAAA